jgi:superfamily I DNA and/or RNA helicase
VLWKSTSKLPEHQERRIGTTFWNAAELKVIRESLRALQFYAEQLDEHLTVGVISGYSGQAVELRRALRRDDVQWTNVKIDVNPVDSFQGQERDVVFYSVVRSNPTGDVGFLRSEERINVALSRAREALVIVGDADFCERTGAGPLPRVVAHVRRSEACTLEDLAND